MREVPGWDCYFMGIAHEVAKRSKDPKKQVGCVIVDPDRHPLSTGYNGFLPGFPDDSTLWDDPATKHQYVLHAEINAVAHAARRGVSLDGAKAYVTLAPCGSCVKAMAASGISSIVCGPVDKIRSEQEEAIKIVRRLAHLSMYSVDGRIIEHASVQR